MFRLASIWLAGDLSYLHVPLVARNRSRKACVQHNQETGDNVGPLVIKVEGDSGQIGSQPES